MSEWPVDDDGRLRHLSKQTCQDSHCKVPISPFVISKHLMGEGGVLYAEISDLIKLLCTNFSIHQWVLIEAIITVVF